ncbi:MAG: SDR family oxidoreductase [Oscillospiraceae bacterium]|nr:SDR family oxidoreductase [Oscillospiraceae bacterium]
MDSIFSLKGKNVVLTGGCGNLGRIMAKHLLDFGANLFIVDVVDAAPAELSDKVNYIKCDLSNTESIHAMFQQVDAAGGLDVLINNAAWGGGAGGKKMTKTRMEDFDDETWAFGLDGVVGVTFRCTRESIPFFRKNGGGSIVNIASMYGVVAPDHSIYGDTGNNSPVTYGAGKAGVVQLTKYTASYLAKDGVRVNAITPGPFPKVSATDPDFLKILQNKTMLGRTGDPNELAGALVLLCSDASSFMTGTNIVVDGGWTAW